MMKKITAAKRGPNHSPIRYTTGDKAFLAFDWIILTVFLVILVYPLLYIISASFTAGVSVMSLSLIPKTVSLAGYKAVFSYKPIWTGYLNSLIYMASGTFVSLAVTVCCAYPLSRPDFKGRGVIMVLCMITMYFSGGLIPTFLQVRNLGLLGSRLSVILPGAMSVYNMIVMRTYFKTQVPREMLESAEMDGCGSVRYLFHILLPLSVPILAVIGLFYAVGFWNSYFEPMMYLANARDKFPLALILRQILILNETSIDAIDPSMLMQIEELRNVMKYAVIIVASLPVLVIYPFVQKYFVKGIMIGAVKG